MRLQRYGFILLSMYLMFFGGSGFYTNTMEVRLFHHALMTGLIVYWLGRRLLRGEGLPHTPINPYLYALVGVWLAAAALGIDPRLSFERTWYMVLHVMIFFFLVNMLQHGHQRLVMETLFLIGGAIVVITIIEIGEWYFGIGGRPGWAAVLQYGVIVPYSLPDRFKVALSSANWLGGYVAPLITVIIAFAATKRGPERKILWFLAAVLVFVLIGTRTRGGYMSFAAGIAVFAFLRFIQIPNLRARISPRLIMAGIVAGLMVIGMVGLVVVVSEERGRDTGDLVRIDMSRAAIEIAQDYPVFGIGTGTFGRALRDYRSPELARDRMAIVHNIFFATLSEDGVIGVIVVIALGMAFLYTAYSIWQHAPSNDRIRREAMFAALIGLGVHSMVDIFQPTHFVTLPLLLFAYLLTPVPPTAKPQSGHRLPAAAMLIIVLVYGVWLVGFVDRASLHYTYSVRLHEEKLYDEAISTAKDAHTIDPALNLYPLHIAWLIGEKALADPTAENIEAGINAYENAVALEPTWDTGWLNLAALETMRGNDSLAYEYIKRAHTINPLNPGNINLARYAEELGDYENTEIVRLYSLSMVSNGLHMPLSSFWSQTPLRAEAARALADRQRIDHRYRVYSALFPNEAAALVPKDPQTGAEHWVVGQHAYAQGDLETASRHFDAAVNYIREGDYFASRARAIWHQDPLSAERDLTLADIMGTRYESTNAIRAQMTTDDSQREILLGSAVPARRIEYSFAGVLYNWRFAPWEPMPQMRMPGPGRAVMQPWYTLAEEAEARGNIDRAIYVYEALVSNAPDETEAAERLATLKAQRD